MASMRESSKRKNAPSRQADGRDRTRVLFICVGNSCRSQMAEALARHLAGDVIEPSSAGIVPLGRIAEATRAVLEERGIRTDGQYSKAYRQEDAKTTDLIVNMTGLPGHAVFLGSKAAVENWPIQDPYGEDLEIHRRICDEIEQRVNELAERLRQSRKNSPKK
jgi:arsenate reductase